MSRMTQAMSTGFKVLAGSDVPAYTLEYLTPTKNKKIGDYETIVINYIEIGRDKKCAVHFDEDTPTVSRKHSAIEKKKEEIIIKNLSQTNPTLVNGRPVNNQWYLNNGDEIQFSIEGPKMRFNVSATGTAKMTGKQKMTLLVQQAVKPYKTYLISLLLLLVTSSSVLGYYLYRTLGDNETLKGNLADSQVMRQQLKSTLEQQTVMAKFMEDSLNQEREKLTRELKSQKAKNAALKDSIKSLASAENLINNDHIYYIEANKVTIKMSDGEDVEFDEKLWIGTGFLVDNNKFVTARHVITPWRFDISNEFYLALNILEQSGEKIIIDFSVKAPSGNTFSFTNLDFKLNEQRDISDSRQYEEESYEVKIANDMNTDWAVLRVESINSDYKSNASLSKNLKQLSEVIIFGYSYGIGGGYNTSPLASKSQVGKDGLENGLIHLTNRGFGSGNSGGPAFSYNNSTKSYEIIGIVSAGVGAEIGILVPIANVVVD